MLNLEQAIADWRRQMLAAGIKTPVPLEELEIHLREEIERQVKSGLDEEQAFSFAVQKIRQAPMIQNEFEKQTPKPLNGKAYRMCGLNFFMLIMVGVPSALLLMNSHDAFIRTSGRVALIGCLLGLMGSCLLGVGVYLGTRKRQR